MVLYKDKKLMSSGVESDVAFEFNLFHEKLYVLKARGASSRWNHQQSWWFLVI